MTLLNIVILLTLISTINAVCYPNFTTFYRPNLNIVESCLCIGCSYSYKFQPGHIYVEVEYRYSTKVTQDFYQNNILIGRCFASLYCNSIFNLDPEYETYTNITQVNNLEKKYNNNKFTYGNHILLFNPL
jgi:hypothetical protein